MFIEMPRAPAVAAEIPTKLGNCCRVMVVAAGRIVTTSVGSNAHRLDVGCWPVSLQRPAIRYLLC